MCVCVFPPKWAKLCGPLALTHPASLTPLTRSLPLHTALEWVTRSANRVTPQEHICYVYTYICILLSICSTIGANITPLPIGVGHCCQLGFALTDIFLLVFSHMRNIYTHMYLFFFFKFCAIFCCILHSNILYKLRLALLCIITNEKMICIRETNVWKLQKRICFHKLIKVKI